MDSAPDAENIMKNDQRPFSSWRSWCPLPVTVVQAAWRLNGQELPIRAVVRGEFPKPLRHPVPHAIAAFETPRPKLTDMEESRYEH